MLASDKFTPDLRYLAFGFIVVETSWAQLGGAVNDHTQGNGRFSRFSFARCASLFIV
jgi:hypothetical protein